MAPDFSNDTVHGHVFIIRVEETDLVSGVQQRTSEGKQAERRQMFLRDAAANGRVRRVRQ
jgi:hypothetical protein